MDPFGILTDQHRRLLELSNALTGGAGDPAGSAGERRRLAQQLVIEGSKHEAIEEQCFWPLVRTALEGGDALAAAGIRQEMGARNMLHELNRMSAGNVHFTTMVFTIASHVRDHLTYEESQIWPSLQLAVDGGRLEEMGDQMARAVKLAPTRPHPHVPPDPRVLRSLAPLSAALDRTLDALTGRGKLTA